MRKLLRVGTRKSPLALVQVREVLNALKEIIPGVKLEIVLIDTVGDRDKKTPISAMEGTDFFTREIDRALLNQQIDFAVHSAKDLSDVIPKGIEVAAITASVDSHDVLVSKNHLKLSELPEGARVGTSSERRKNQIKAYRPDFEVIDIRGTIEERLNKLESEGLDAIVVAGAGLVRLGLSRYITEKISFYILKPHSLQGCLALTVRKEDKDLKQLLARLHRKKIASYADESGERTFRFKKQIKKRRILVTGTSIERFKNLGEIIHVPMIEIKPVKDFRLMDVTIKQLEQYDGILFTSKHAVQYFLERLQKKSKTIGTLRKKMLIAIGRTTEKRLSDYGLSGTLVSKDESAQGMIKMLRSFPLKGKRFLIPRSNLANDQLVEALQKSGACVDTVTVYRNVKTKAVKQDLTQIDEVVFTSPSTVKNFFEKYKNIPPHIRVRAIGPVTGEYLKKYGKKAKMIETLS